MQSDAGLVDPSCRPRTHRRSSQTHLLCNRQPHVGIPCLGKSAADRVQQSASDPGNTSTSMRPLSSSHLLGRVWSWSQGRPKCLMEVAGLLQVRISVECQGAIEPARWQVLSRGSRSRDRGLGPVPRTPALWIGCTSPVRPTACTHARRHTDRMASMSSRLVQVLVVTIGVMPSDRCKRNGGRGRKRLRVFTSTTCSLAIQPSKPIKG